MTNQQSICHRAFSAMVDDVESLSLLRECRERYKTNFTSAILSATEKVGNQNCTKEHQQDRPITVAAEGFQVSLSAQDC